MKYLFTTVTFIFLVACNIQAQNKTSLPIGWKSINGCTIGLNVQADIEFVKDSSVDTCEREYRSKNILIYITVTEWNIGSDEYSDWLEYCLVKTNINMKKAEIITSFKPKRSENDVFENGGFNYTAMMLVPQFRKGAGNLIIRTFSKTLADRNNAIKILHTAEFDKK